MSDSDDKKYPTLPTKLFILGHSIDVVPVTRTLSGDCIGECDYDQGAIFISDSMMATQAHSTLLHEVVHFIDKELCLGLEENQLGPLAAVLFSVLKAHPEILG